MKNFLKYLLVIALCVITVSSQTMPVAAYAADTFVKYLECGRKTEKLAYNLDIKPEATEKKAGNV